MLTRRLAVCFAVLALLLVVLTACGSGQDPARASGGPTAPARSTPAPQETLSPAGASAADLEKLTRQIFPGAQSVGCNWHDRTNCPVTDRLARRLDQLTATKQPGPGPTPPLCRCQNGPESVGLRAEPTAGGGVAHVTLGFGAGSFSGLDLIVVERSGVALVDDTRCTAGVGQTSLYAAELTDCSRFPTPAAPSCTLSGAASAPGPLSPIVGSAASGDTLTLNFKGGTPAFEVATQPASSFPADPSGRQTTLAGSSGVRIVLRGFRGDVSNLAAVPKSLTSQGQILRQVAAIGDSEGVVSFGAGLSAPGCAQVTSSSSSLVFHFLPIR